MIGDFVDPAELLWVRKIRFVIFFEGMPRYEPESVRDDALSDSQYYLGNSAQGVQLPPTPVSTSTALLFTGSPSFVRAAALSRTLSRVVHKLPVD